MHTYINKLLILVALTLTTSVYGQPLLDLTQDLSSFILEEKQIVIPGYPDAFNPSIVRWDNGKLLLSFRARDPLTGSTHLMGFVWLNENFEVVSKPSMLINIQYNLPHPLKVSRAQDPRLVKIGKAYYIVFNNIVDETDLEKRRMLMGRLHIQNNHFFVINPEYLLNFHGDPKNSWREKNWAPFDFNGTLLFSYSLNPHRIFLPFIHHNSCQTLALSQADTNWKWGELRGGTPSLVDGDKYLGFFHSYVDIPTVQSKGKKISHYFMGAYLFEKELPFSLTHIIPKPILGSTFYVGPDYPTWKPLRVVFPGGHIIDDQYVWVVYGRQDHETWVVKMDKQGLLDSLVAIESEVLTIDETE